MKSYTVPFILFFFATTFCSSNDLHSREVEKNFPNPVSFEILDATTPLYIPVHHQISLGVKFPGPIQAPAGIAFSPNLAEQEGDYELIWRPGDSHFFVNAIENAQTSNILIPYEDSIYTIFCYPVTDPLDALSSLTLMKEPPRPRSEEPIIKTTPSEVISRKPRYKKASIARQTGFLDMLKLIHASSEAELNSYKSTLKGLTIGHSSDEWLLGDGDVKLTMVRSVRNDIIDSLGFILTIENTSKTQVFIDPDSFSIRVGAANYRPSIVEAPDMLEANTAQSLYVIIKGNGRDGPGNLAEDNKWIVTAAISKNKDS